MLPLYYRLRLTSIYEYLESRFGFWSYKVGAFYFLLSRTVGAAFRLFVVAMVLQEAIFDAWDIPFGVTVAITIGLIWLYTFRGGIKTIVWTDTLQTLFMLSAVGAVIYFINGELGFTFSKMYSTVSESEYSKIFQWEWQPGTNFFKQFFSGAFLAIVMTGLDQDMMQKNLTCKNVGEAQKNMFWFSIVLVVVNLVFLTLGALLYIYSATKGIPLPEESDELFSNLSLNHFDVSIGVLFILGITAAAYSSADSALTSLTTSFCVDFLSFKNEDTVAIQSKQTKTRLMVHLGFSVLLIAVILVFKALNNDAIINSVFKAAGYTYGPLLGLYAFGLFTEFNVRDKLVPIICLSSPLLSYLISLNSKELFYGYEFGFEILIVNGAITFVGLLLLQVRNKDINSYE